MGKIDIIVVGYNQSEFEANTLRAVIAHTSYGTYKLTYAQNDKGRSLAACWNELIDQSACELVCLLNPDTVPAMGWLGMMRHVYECDTEHIGAVVPSSNLVHISQIETPFDRFERDWGKINAFAETMWKGKSFLTGIDATRLPFALTCKTLSAMCVLFPKSTWRDAGGFDEDFPLYGEDTEFFWRVREKLGKRLLWCRYAYVHHYKAQSVAKAVTDGELDYSAVRQRAVELCTQKGVKL